MAAAGDSGQIAGPPIQLLDGERVILDLHPSRGWTAPIYVVTLGLWEFWRRRHHFVLTNQRIVIAKGILSKQERSAQLDRAQDVRVDQSVLTGGRVYISTAGPGPGLRVGDPHTPLSRDDARAFADALTPLIGKGGTP